VTALAVLLGPSEDEMAASSPGLQGELAAALCGKLRGRPLAAIPGGPVGRAAS